MTIIKLLHDAELSELLPAMMRIENEVQVHPWTEGMFADCIGGGYRVFGMFENDVLIGYAVYDYVLDEATLENISVAGTAQGRGNGRTLLQDSMKALRNELNIARFLLEVRVSNLKAINLYKSVGFKQDAIRKNYYPVFNGREDGVLMSVSIE